MSIMQHGGDGRHESVDARVAACWLFQLFAQTRQSRRVDRGQRFIADQRRKFG